MIGPTARAASDPPPPFVTVAVCGGSIGPPGHAENVNELCESWIIGGGSLTSNVTSRTLDVSPDLLRRQVTLIGSWTFSAMGMLDCARFIADNKIDLERIFSHRWRLEQADEAYRAFDTQTTGKGVFLF